MKAKCRKCGDTIEVTKLREYKTCKCGAIGLDYGDEFYYRVVGNPENFEGEIEDAPKVKDRVKPSELCNVDESMERAMDIIGEENIGGESKPMGKIAELRDPDNPSEEGTTEIAMDATNTRLVDTNLNNIATCLGELSIVLEEASDLVSRMSRLVMERTDKSEEFKNMMKGE